MESQCFGDYGSYVINGAIRNKSIRISKEHGEKINEENTINWKIG